ncbi:MAG: hypothetical protein QNJ44_00245 [Rhodobacter sp.]|nr:hypothetical protein [Rhodobacter sp.]
MSKSIKLVLTLGLVAFVAACAQQEEEPVFIDPEPITVEPPFTGKYK